MDLIWRYAKPLLTSKKFQATVAGIIVAALAKIQFAIPEDLVNQIVALIIAFVLAQGWADAGKEKAKIEADAALTQRVTED